MANTVSPSTVHHIAQLANIPITQDEEQKLSHAFSQTLEVVAHMSQLDTTSIEPTHQVTGLENVFREDQVDEGRMFSQSQALANATQQHDGYFVVKQVISQE